MPDQARDEEITEAGNEQTAEAKDEQIAGARAYEGLHVPALFHEWVEPVLEAARVGPGDRVLDVACGTGVLARGAFERVGDRGFVAGADPDPGMLHVAAESAPGVEWRMGPAETLPFPNASFDAVVSQFGIMFFSDRPRALEEMLRVLAPGGRLAVAVWDSLENTPAYATEVELLEELAGPDAADALRAPFVMGDPEELRRLIEKAGAESVTVASRTGTARFPTLRSMVEADLRGWLPVMGVHLSEEIITEILERAEEAMADFVTPDGRAEFDSPAHIVRGARA